MRRFLKSGRWVLVGAFVAAVLVGGVAWATMIPSDQGVYTGCYMKVGGALRVIDASKSCKSWETRITWNQRGEPGAAGEAGAGVAGFFRTFGTPTPLVVPTGADNTRAPLAILWGLPANGSSFATASVNVLNGSGDAVNLICALGEFGGAVSFTVPHNETGGPGAYSAHVSFTGGSNSSGVPFGCHVSSEKPIVGVTVSGTIEAIALTSLTVQP